MKLATQKDWLTITKLANYLDCSTRVLRDDIQYLNSHYNSIQIQTSKYGVRLCFKENHGLSNFCREMIAHSDAYQVLESIFFNQPSSIKELSEMLFISQATLYRLIDKMNTILKVDYGFLIATNPCRFEGSEARIRYFFYIYFFERYPRFNLPFKNFSEDMIDLFLKALLKDFPFTIDFAFHNVTRVVMMVNLIRYRNNHFIPTDKMELSSPRLANSFDDYSELFKPYEEELNVSVDNDFITQIFTPYIQKGMSFSYEDFIAKTEEDSLLLEQVNFLRDLLDNIATKNKIQLANREQLVFGLFNVVHLEYQDPQSNYILYKRNQLFAEDVKEEFPQLYKDISEGMKAFREKLERPTTNEGVAFFIYQIFIMWENLVPQMRKKIDKINVLVISDRHKAHAEMIKGFIQYEFSEQVIVNFFTDSVLNPRVLDGLDYDLLITTFTIDTLENKRHVYIPNVPKYTDYQKIQRAIDNIIHERLYE